MRAAGGSLERWAARARFAYAGFGQRRDSVRPDAHVVEQYAEMRFARRFFMRLAHDAQAFGRKVAAAAIRSVFPRAKHRLQ